MNIFRALPFTLFSVAITATSAWAQLDRPQVAWMIDEQNALRAVIGTASTASIGDPMAQDVSSLACFPEICFAKISATIYSSSGWAAEAPEGPVLFTYANGSAYVYFLETGAVAKWNGEDLAFLPFSPGGEVLALRAASDGFDYAIARNSGTWVEHYSERDEPVTPIAPLGDTGAVLLLDADSAQLALVARADVLQLVRLDGPTGSASDLRPTVLNIPAVGSMFPVGNGYIQVNTPAATWLLRVNAICTADHCETVAQVEVSLLPPPPPTLMKPPAPDAASDTGPKYEPETEATQ